MAIIAPFKGQTYNFHTMQNFSKLTAPPYDVISKKEQDALYRADPHNVIRLILGKKKTGDSDWDNRYIRAADYYNRWESEGTLIRASQPSIYVTSLTYEPEKGAAPRTRWGMITLVRIEDQDSGVILPHEKTFSAHKEDRLKLMRACNVQFSQIFGLYEDPDNSILNALKEVINCTPQIVFDFKDGTRHQMWILQDPAIIKKVAESMSKKSIFIADGHHRYETSRNFRNIMRARYGMRTANRSYEYTMMYLTNMDDEGLTILPSHRILKSAPNFQINPFFERIKRWFDITKSQLPLPNTARERTALKQRLKEGGQHNPTFGFYHKGDDQLYILSLKPGAIEMVGDDLHPMLKRLDVLVLSRLILQKGLGFSKEDLDDDKVFHYESSVGTAMSHVQSGDYQMTFLLNPTKMEHVKEIASKSLIMPRKSTYFYPKILTGLVFNKIDPYETIQIT